MVDIEQNEVNFSSFGKQFQEKLAYLIMQDPVFANQIGEVLDFNFFELKYLRVFTKKIFDYKKKYGKYPSQATVETILRSEMDEENEAIQKQIREFYARLTSGIAGVDDEYVKTNSVEFCKKQKLKEAMIKSVELLKQSSFEEIRQLIDNAIKLGTNSDFGYSYDEHFEQRYELKARNVVSTGWDVFDGFMRGGLGRGELGVVVAPTGCHAKGTKILMSDGHLKNVEDIRVGDELMGPNSTPRKVLHLHHGNEEMFMISPTKGKPFIVNRGHILSLVRTNDGTSKAQQVVNISVGEYVQKSKTFKHIHKLWRPTALSFANATEVSEPYIVGSFIGDGCTVGSTMTMTTADQEMRDEIAAFTNRYSCEVSSNIKNVKTTDYRFLGGRKNSVFALLQEAGITDKKAENKFIPFKYKTSSVSSRLELLAGLIDTDGSYDGHDCFDFISKSRQLAEDVVFVSQSLGLAAYVSPCVKSDQNGVSGTYYRVCISGDIDTIPTRISRKKALPRKQKKSVLRTGFTVEPVGIDEYYGFEVDGDNLYVMEDFFVTHNSGKSFVLVHLGAQAVKQGKTVLHYTLELDDKTIGLRYDSAITGIPLDALHAKKDVVFEKIKDVQGKLIIKEYPTKSASTGTIRNHLEKIKQRGIEVGMIIVDYGDLLKPVSSKKEKREELETIYEELRGLAKETGCPIWTASQTNRSGLNAEVNTLESISEAFNKCFVADFIFTVSRTLDDKKTNGGRMLIAKNRFGADGLICPIFMDTSCAEIKVFEPTTETKEDIEKKASKKQLNKLKEKYQQFKASDTPTKDKAI